MGKTGPHPTYINVRGTSRQQVTVVSGCCVCSDVVVVGYLLELSAYHTDLLRVSLLSLHCRVGKSYWVGLVAAGERVVDC